MLRHKRHIKRAKELGSHPFVVPVVTFIALITLAAAVFIVLSGRPGLQLSDSHIVKLSVKGTDQTLPTRAKTVGELLERLSITLEKNDVVEPAVDTPIVEDNFHVNVYRARPVTIVDGDNKTYASS